MNPPNIDYFQLHQAIESAELMLKPYDENLAGLNRELEILDREILAATPIVELISRTNTRREALEECSPYNDFYS